MVEKPRYGGTFTGAWESAAVGYDDAYFSPSLSYTFYMTNEQLTKLDWSRGPTGTGELEMWIPQYDARYEVGAIAETWELPDANTVIFHIRQGIHWALNAGSEG